MGWIKGQGGVGWWKWVFSEGNAPYIKSGGGGSVRFLMVVGMLHKGMRLEGGGGQV